MQGRGHLVSRNTENSDIRLQCNQKPAEQRTPLLPAADAHMRGSLLGAVRRAADQRGWGENGPLCLLGSGTTSLFSGPRLPSGQRWQRAVRIPAWPLGLPLAVHWQHQVCALWSKPPPAGDVPPAGDAGHRAGSRASRRQRHPPQALRSTCSSMPASLAGQLHTNKGQP
jgi:hypothetical protein